VVFVSLRSGVRAELLRRLRGGPHRSCRTSILLHSRWVRAGSSWRWCAGGALKAVRVEAVGASGLRRVWLLWDGQKWQKHVEVVGVGWF